MYFNTSIMLPKKLVLMRNVHQYMLFQETYKILKKIYPINVQHVKLNCAIGSKYVEWHIIRSTRQ